MSNNNLCVIVPARGGSKGILGKNIKVLGREPLLNWAIKIAKDISSNDQFDIYVSTDCPRIEKVGEKCGAQVIRRPENLARDNSKVISMVDHHLRLFESRGKSYELIIYLEPTSPFRTSKEVRQCVDILRANKLDSVATFAKVGYDVKSLLKQNKDGCISKYCISDESISTPFTPYVLSGAVYVFNVKSYTSQRPAGIYFGNRGHVIQTSPHVDIDEPYDLEIARNLLGSLKDSYWASLGLL